MQSRTQRSKAGGVLGGTNARGGCSPGHGVDTQDLLGRGWNDRQKPALRQFLSFWTERWDIFSFGVMSVCGWLLDLQPDEASCVWTLWLRPLQFTDAAIHPAGVSEVGIATFNLDVFLPQGRLLTQPICCDSAFGGPALISSGKNDFPTSNFTDAFILLFPIVGSG